MAKTEEQSAADKALTAAIEAHMRAYADDKSLMDRYMLAEYIVIISHHGLREGEEVTMTNVIFKDNDIPATRALGLARFGQLYMDRYVLSPDD